MGRIVSNFFISLDGVVESPDTWHFTYFDDPMGEIVGLGMSTTGAMMMGRRLYDEWSDFWPGQGPEVPFSEFINTVPKYVLSTTLTDPSWQNTTVLSGDVAEECAGPRRAPRATSGCPAVRPRCAGCWPTGCSTSAPSWCTLRGGVGPAALREHRDPPDHAAALRDPGHRGAALRYAPAC